MQLAINTLSVDASKGGIRVFLLGTLCELVEQHSGWRFRLIVSKANKDLFDDLRRCDNVDIVVAQFAGKNVISRIFADQVIIPKLIRGCSVLLTPSNVMTVCAGIPQVVVIQAPLAVKGIRELPYVPPNLVSPFHKFYYDWGLKKTLQKATRIVAVSDFLKVELDKLSSNDASKITVIHEGVSFSVQRRQKDANEGNFLLFVSSLFPYKNADKLIQALGELCSRNALPAELSLIFCGKDPDGAQVSRLRGIAADCGVEDRLDFRGHVTHKELKELYANCRAFVYPSSVETFGLPLLEAMAFGAPVICSDKMSVPEVAGDAGLIVDPLKEGELADAILKLWHNRELADDLREKGYQRVTKFSWAQCASSLAAILSAVAKAPEQINTRSS